MESAHSEDHRNAGKSLISFALGNVPLYQFVSFHLEEARMHSRIWNTRTYQNGKDFSFALVVEEVGNFRNSREMTRRLAVRLEGNLLSPTNSL